MEESMSLLLRINREFDCQKADMRVYSPLTLAFVGDGIYEIIVRTVLVERGNRSVNSLNKMKSGLVRAQTQAALSEALSDMLTDEEAAVYRRGRNATTHSTAKNASVSDYRKATGFEALCGYLYLTDRTERLTELIKRGLERLGLTL